MTWIVLLLLLAAFGAGLRYLFVRSRDVEDETRYQSEDARISPPLGIWGIFSKRR